MNEEERRMLTSLRDQIETCLGLPETAFRENKEGFTGRPNPEYEPIIIGSFLIYPNCIRYRQPSTKGQSCFNT